ncbi:MAG: NAD(+)/NADH kinase [Treponema sp.]|jgi:NAD+ kinase|nr:NAD(+)/NADH kinase [Treponema sp.]
MLSIKRAVLFINLHKENSREAADEIRCELEKRKIDVTIFSFEGKPANPPSGNWDIAFSLGGDGTVLYTARCLSRTGVPIMAVNLGTLGFIAEVEKEKWLQVFTAFEDGSIKPSRRCMLELSVERKGEIVTRNICLNDAVISASGIAKLIKLDVELDGWAHLGSYRSDGLIIATPTGSTAYSMAAGGPILDPEMEALILCPICPFSLSNRPLVLPAGKTLSVRVEQERGSAVLLTVDGQDTFNLEYMDRVRIRAAEYPALLVLEDRNSYYSALKTKLFWSGGNNA